MNTHETYVSLETDKLLKQAGFDWECRKIYYCYHEDGDKWELEDNYKNHKHILKLDHCLLTPTLEVAQRWLREVKQCYVHVYPMFSFEGTLEYYFVEVIYPRSRDVKQNEFSTYEEAQEAGIKKALEMILEKGE